MTVASDIVAFPFVPVSEAGNWQQRSGMSRFEGAHSCASSSRVRDYLRMQFRWRGGAKVLARLAGCSHRTCHRWLQGRASPSAEHLAEMLSHPRFRERFLAEIDRQRRGE